MIKVAGDHYALSLNSIDGVHFMSPDSLRSAVASDGCIQYGGREYELQYLGSLLNKDLEHRARQVDRLCRSGVVPF
jgi:chemotaxis protein histidine kinase CheA